MGLTIHYGLKTSLTRPAYIRTLVESFRQVARDLPFKEVGEVVEFQGQDADQAFTPKDDPHNWLKIQAMGFTEQFHRVTPLHIIAFDTWPGEGCEAANFGFCRYPATVEVPAEHGRTKKIATNLNGWCWGSFCKTQYASNPQCGGVQHFLRCHLCVVKMLDFIKKTGLVAVEVKDEGGYWQHRDLSKLAKEVGEWNEFIAAFAGILKDQASQDGVVIESAIAGFGNFEHLEAKGLERLEKLRQRKDSSQE